MYFASRCVRSKFRHWTKPRRNSSVEVHLRGKSGTRQYMSFRKSYRSAGAVQLMVAWLSPSSRCQLQDGQKRHSRESILCNTLSNEGSQCPGYAMRVTGASAPFDEPVPAHESIGEVSSPLRQIPHPRFVWNFGCMGVTRGLRRRSHPFSTPLSVLLFWRGTRKVR